MKLDETLWMKKPNAIVIGQGEVKLTGSLFPMASPHHFRRGYKDYWERIITYSLMQLWTMCIPSEEPHKIHPAVQCQVCYGSNQLLPGWIWCPLRRRAFKTVTLNQDRNLWLGMHQALMGKLLLLSC